MVAMRKPGHDASIAPASQRDYGDVVALLETARLPTEDLERASMAHFLAARNEAGELIGAIGVEHYGLTALLRSLVVATGFRSRGVGGRLLAELEGRCRASGITDLFLLTTSARAFFAGRNYRAIERDAVPAALRAAAEFTRLCPDTAVCMTKRL